MLFNRWALEEFLRCHVMTKAELAKQAELSPGYISDLLNGNKVNPTRTAVKRIAKALRVDSRAFAYELPADIAKQIA